MRRRTLLSITAGSLASVAGCTGDPGGNDATAAETSSSDETTTVTDTDVPTATPAATDTEAKTETETARPPTRLAVEIERVNYVAQTYEVSEGRGIDPDDIVPEGEIPEVLRDALLDARDGGFETDSVSDELLAAIDDFRGYARTAIDPYVRLDGTAYVFEPTVPTFTARLADEELEEYDESRVLGVDQYDFDSEAVESFVRALRSDGPNVPRSEYRTSLVPAPVESFLDRYDYLEDGRGVSRIVTDRVDTEPPHTIEVRELTDEDVWGRPVVGEDAFSEELRAFFRSAIDSDHRAPAMTSPTRSQYFTDHVPDAYFELVEEHDNPYFRLDDTVYGISAGSPRYDEIPVSVSVDETTPGRENTDADADGDEREFTLTLEPTRDSEAEVADDALFDFSSRGALPSVLWVTHDGERRLLESDVYDRDRWYDAPDDPKRDKRPANQALNHVEADEKVAATYAVPADLPDGTYVSRGYFTVSWDVPDEIQDEHAGYPFRLSVTVESE